MTCVIAMGMSWWFRTLFDDAFISFRYAQNLVHGRGLVFNVGERVEGYTNFLWVLVLAGAGRLGFDIVRCATVLGIVFGAAAVVATERLSRQLAPNAAR
ncbi:MAG TPA: hypothetical protein VK524_05155, partial [Polyangiaceae bacterium]|nr:hypothetical protein [Polyangiaceae bacterium]